jgi:DNA-binding GntR family transcriptional regulator
MASALAVSGPTAVLELEEIMHLASGEAVQHSSDLFAPDGIDLQVRRNLEVAAPAPLVRAASRV